MWGPAPWFNIKISSYQHRKSHCGDKTVVRSSYLHNGFPILVRWHGYRCRGTRAASQSEHIMFPVYTLWPKLCIWDRCIITLCWFTYPCRAEFIAWNAFSSFPTFRYHRYSKSFLVKDKDILNAIHGCWCPARLFFPGIFRLLRQKDQYLVCNINCNL